MKKITLKALTLGITLAVVALVWASPASAGTCTHPCIVAGVEPQVTLDASTGINWEVEAAQDGTQFRIGPDGGATEPFRLGSTAPENSLFIESGTGDIGLGGVPSHDLHVFGADLFLGTPGVAGGQWRLWTGGTGFWLSNNDDSATTPVKFNNNSPDNSLVVQPAGIGIGTDVPSEDLDIRGSSPTIALTDVSGTTVNRIWEINSDGQSSDFDIRDVTGGTSPFQIASSTGNEALDGAIVIDSTGVTLSSSRTVKKNIEPATPKALLDELAALPIYTWSYTSDGTGTTHVGPMAEDFYHRFGFGSDEKRISSVDTTGVALAAIKALNDKLEQRDAEIAELKAAVELLLAERAE